jgi:tetratricopeptide (TPR) repeat protein
MTTDTQIDTLEAKGLIRLAALRPELEYLFRHWLVQDAAYGSLLKQERRALHGQVGEALEELYPERRGELSPVLGMHFEQAGETEKAIEYYVAGARHALGQYAIQEAYAGFDRAAALIEQEANADAAPATDEIARRRRRQIEVELGRADAGYSFRAPEESFEALERVVTAAEDLGDAELLSRVHTLIALGRLQNGEPADAPLVKRSLDRISEIGEAIGDPSLRAMPMALVGLSQVFSGPVQDGVAALEVALPLIEDRQDTIGAAFARGGLAIGYATLGEFEKADAAAAQATAIAARGDLIAQLDALIAESFVRSVKGDLETAVPLAQRCVERSEETGASACMVVSSWILGDAFHRQGRFSEARDILKRGSDISLVVDRKVWRPTLQAWLGSATAALGTAEDGDWDSALAMARSIGNTVGEAGILGKRAEAAVSRGDIDGARADAEASFALMESLGIRPYLARGLRSWGEALHAAGRTGDAEPVLRRALALFDELVLEKEAAAVRALLALGNTTIVFD